MRANQLIKDSNYSGEILNVEKVDKAYSSEPWYYDLRGFLILTFAYQTSLWSQIHLFANRIGKNHLEIAIGSGTLFELILKWRKITGKKMGNIVGFDYAEKMLSGARRRFRKHFNITLLRADAANLPLLENRFDTANIANAIHCLPDIGNSLKEIHRVLKSGGTLTGNCLLYPKSGHILTPIAKRINDWGMKKGILFRPYYESEITEALISSGFEISKIEVRGNCLNFVAEKK